MDTISGRIANSKRMTEIKFSNIVSTFTIIFLSGMLVLFIILNFNMMMKINKSSSHTIVYKHIAKEEPTVLRVNF